MFMIQPIQNYNVPKRQIGFRGNLNKSLCQDIWAGETLKQGVAIRLKMLADTFEKTLAASNFKRKDLTIVGSMANYNYGKASDIDLHLVTDFSEYPADRKFLTDYFNSKRDMFNYTNSFNIFGHPVEVSVEDAASKTYSKGRYSLMSDEWIKKPVFDEKLELPDVTSSQTYLDLKKSLDECLAKNDFKSITPLFQQIYALRQSGLAQGGEFSMGNSIFRQLRNEGYLKKLIDLSYNALNNLISLK